MFTQIQGFSAGYKNKFAAATESDVGLRNGELLKLTGPAIFLDKISGNGRKYIADSVHIQVAELQSRIAKKALFGCLDHPPVDDLNALAYVKMTDVSHRIDALWFNKDEATYYITVTILDTPNGRILKAIYDSGSPLYVSLRSLLDPSRNVQRNGYVDAFMLALITVDFVSRPGFADAELKAVNVSNECALAVCESLNLFQSKRIFDMKVTKQKCTGKYIPIIAMESIAGIAVEPQETFKDEVTLFITDALDKLPGKFTASDFSTAYPNSMFNNNIIGLYEDTAELMIQESNGKTVAMIPLKSDSDGEFAMQDNVDIQYFDTEVVANVASNGADDTATEMYAVIATEDYTPSAEFIENANAIADYMRENYGDGFSKDDFEGSIKQYLLDNFNVTSSIDIDDEHSELQLEQGENAASLLLELADDKFVPKYISEYWQPGTEDLNDVVQQTDGNQIPEASHKNDNYQTSNLKDANNLSIEVLDEDEEVASAQASATMQMYEIMEDANATVEIADDDDSDDSDDDDSDDSDDNKDMAVIEDDDDDMAVIEDDDDDSDKEKHKDEDEHYDDNPDETRDAIAAEAQRVFNMPNSKFAGIYAIEHMPDTHKHIWSGLTDTAKSVIAKQAAKLCIANESDNLRFWSKTNFIAIERACIINSGKVEAALESFKPVDNKVAFLGLPLPSAH